MCPDMDLPPGSLSPFPRLQNRSVRNTVPASETNIGAPERPNVIVLITSTPRSTHTAIFTAFRGTVAWSHAPWAPLPRVYATEKEWYRIVPTLGHPYLDFHCVRWIRKSGRKSLVATERDTLGRF